MCFMQIESVLQTENRSEPAKTRFSVTLLWAQCFFHADSKDSDQTGQMPIWVLAGPAGHFVGFVMLRSCVSHFKASNVQPNCFIMLSKYISENTL